MKLTTRDRQAMSRLAASRLRMRWDFDAKDSLGRDIWQAPSPNGDGTYKVQKYADGKIRWMLDQGSGRGVSGGKTFRSWERAAKDAEAHAFGTGSYHRQLAASDRAALIRLASDLPKGSEERRSILAGLQKEV